jgi:uncharacterized protein YndB with AHSA1/START domain
MRRDLRLERIYPYAPSVVWQAISDPAALGEWLMPVFDFAPEVGREFTFRVKPQPGWDGVVHCSVLEVLPEQRLRFSWLGGGIETEVAFTLEPVAAGTRLLLEHTGFDGLRAVLISRFLRGGWGKMTRDKLPRVLARLAGGDSGGQGAAEQCHTTLIGRIVGRLTELLPK